MLRPAAVQYVNDSLGSPSSAFRCRLFRCRRNMRGHQNILHLEQVMFRGETVRVEHIDYPENVQCGVSDDPLLQRGGKIVLVCQLAASGVDKNRR